MKFLFVFAICLSCAGNVLAQKIGVAPSYKLGEKIVIEFTGGNTIEDAETKLDWTLPPALVTEAGSNDGRRLLAWTTEPGKYPIKLQASYTLDVVVPDPADPTKTKTRKITFPPYVYEAEFTVVGNGPTPPNPPPVDPDKPLTGLALLVPDKANRILAAEFYSDLAIAVPLYSTTTHFRSGYRAAIAASQGSGALPKGISAIDKPISDRITAAIGLADAPMDAAKQAALAAVLNGVAQELNQ